MLGWIQATMQQNTIVNQENCYLVPNALVYFAESIQAVVRHSSGNAIIRKLSGSHQVF